MRQEAGLGGLSEDEWGFSSWHTTHQIIRIIKGG